MLHQPLADLSIGCPKVGISDVRASDVVPLLDDQAKGWRPCLDDDEVLSVACSSLFCPHKLFADSHIPVSHLESLSAGYFASKLPLELHFAPIF